MPEKVRVGIIGAGKIAQARHIPLMQSVGDVYITHAWSRTPETAQKAAREFGIPNVVDRWVEIVDSPQIDAVVIATPPNLHLPATLAALDAGKHVLSQARMARNLSEALRMLEASKATDLVTALYPAGFGLKGISFALFPDAVDFIEGRPLEGVVLHIFESTGIEGLNLFIGDRRNSLQARKALSAALSGPWTCCAGWRSQSMCI